MSTRGQPSIRPRSEQKVMSEVGCEAAARMVYKTLINGAAALDAALQILIAVVDRVVALAVAVLLLLKLTLQLLVLQLLIGRVAVLLAIERTVALALFDLAIEIALTLLRLGEGLGLSMGLRTRPAGRNGDQRQRPQGMAKQGAVQHTDNVALGRGFSKAQKSERNKPFSGQKRSGPGVGPLPYA